VSEPWVPEIDPLIHEPARLRLLVLLSVLGSADFAYLLQHTGLSRGNLSVQSRKLADAGHLEIDKAFVGNRPRTTYALTRSGREALAAYRTAMLEILETIPRAGK
jgi:DNA-binding MarR family transcriptional regulator